MTARLVRKLRLRLLARDLRWLERQMGKPDFWDQPYAAGIASEHARVSRLRQRLQLPPAA